MGSAAAAVPEAGREMIFDKGAYFLGGAKRILTLSLTLSLSITLTLTLTLTRTLTLALTLGLTLALTLTHRQGYLD